MYLKLNMMQQLDPKPYISWDTCKSRCCPWFPNGPGRDWAEPWVQMFILIPKAEVCYQIPTTLSKFPNERKWKSGGERLPFGGGAGEEQQERWSICDETSMLLWIPCRCLGWQCPCPFVIYCSRAFSQKDACSHIQGMFIFPATNHACLRTRVAVWKKIFNSLFFRFFPSFIFPLWTFSHPFGSKSTCHHQPWGREQQGTVWKQPAGLKLFIQTSRRIVMNNNKHSLRSGYVRGQMKRATFIPLQWIIQPSWTWKISHLVCFTKEDGDQANWEVSDATTMV